MDIVSPAEIELCFSEEVLNDTQKAAHAKIREKAKELAFLILDIVPDSKEQVIAINACESAVTWAKSGIARRTIDVGIGTPPELARDRIEIGIAGTKTVLS